MLKKLLCLAASVMLTACSMLPGLGGAPPQVPAIQNISRAPLDFALNSFDAALYGLDFAMDARALTPGSDTARRIAAAGRRVMNFLGACEAARDLGNSATYEQAFTNAKTALDEFRALLPARPAAFGIGFGHMPPLTPAQRERILHRLEAGGGGAPHIVAR